MSVVGVGIISKRGERRKYLPLEIRAKMYEDVLKLGRQGLTYKEIQEKLFEKYGKQLCMKNIYDWINGKHNPLGKVNKFDEKPSPELEYVIGAIFSDGNKYFSSEGYRLRLEVKDKEYAEEFGRCLAKVIGRRKPYKPYWDENQKRWIVAGCSILLFKFLEKPLEELKIYIEHCKDCVSAFLRALFDGDGHIYKRKLMFYNTNKELLVYVQYLLKKYFDVEATGPHLVNGKKDYYYIYIRAKSLLNFYKYIGFTIKRKQKTLIKAIKQ